MYEDDTDDEPFVNEDCPDGCSEEHRPPDVRRDGGLWECPTTGNEYRYCEPCGGWEHTRWGDGSTRIAGEWYCDPYDHGWGYCDVCGSWQDESEMVFDHDGDVVCESCADYRRHEPTPTAPGEQLYPCAECHTLPVNLHLETEEFLCNHAAADAIARREPVLVAA